MTETINGLHKCQPKNEPQQGEVKNMVVEHKPPRDGKKAWIKIKNELPEKGGSPYRILNVERLPWEPDNYGNVSFNLEIEASSSQPSVFQQTKAAMQQDDQSQIEKDVETMWGDLPKRGINAPESSVHTQQGEDGVTEARKHLMRCCNLYNLCIAAVDKAIAPNLPEIARTSEQFQATLASLWIEASSRRSTDGVTWWSWVDKMPDKPVPNGKHSTTAKPIQKTTVEEMEVPF